MDLREIEIPVCWDAPPPKILRTIEIADRLRETLMSDACDSDIPALVNSNFYIAYHALKHVRDTGMGGDLSFCEWGSGLGVVTCIASQLGFNATGIEIEGSLCEFARTLADEAGVAAEFIQASYRDLRREGTLSEGRLSEGTLSEGTLSDGTLSGGTLSGAVVYVYPWPAEERFIESVFRDVTDAGSVLISYHGGTSLRARRKRS
ncbi:hypothetical protein Mal15_55400 [Stieleria maiorica]|uniref:Methyltransferase domain protein n=1 Tax=Stieleria maiorica TaxID=2795974 RepID=A0A5B9MKM5_9BACT|nr:class I SAM-dependent methyltransferase [Stieleria maiorica]QEG01464.1 hypothetical protein Mal15_55400 [Stieleria maiorica]